MKLIKWRMLYPLGKCYYQYREIPPLTLVPMLKVLLASINGPIRFGFPSRPLLLRTVWQAITLPAKIFIYLAGLMIMSIAV
jgi:hypothetical protein